MSSLFFSLDLLATKNQISTHVFCSSINLKREENSMASFRIETTTKNFGCHLVFTKYLVFGRPMKRTLVINAFQTDYSRVLENRVHIT